jgi:hypothetical protein
MNTVAGIVFIVAVLIAGMLWLLYVAPEGWQDKDGFHYGKEPREKKDE